MDASFCCVFKDLRVMKVQEQVDSEMAMVWICLKAGVRVLLMGAEGVFYLFKIKSSKSSRSRWPQTSSRADMRPLVGKPSVRLERLTSMALLSQVSFIHLSRPLLLLFVQERWLTSHLAPPCCSSFFFHSCSVIPAVLAKPDPEVETMTCLAQGQQGRGRVGSS